MKNVYLIFFCHLFTFSTSPLSLPLCFIACCVYTRWPALHEWDAIVCICHYEAIDAITPFMLKLYANWIWFFDWVLYLTLENFQSFFKRISVPQICGCVELSCVVAVVVVVSAFNGAFPTFISDWYKPLPDCYQPTQLD